MNLDNLERQMQDKLASFESGMDFDAGWNELSFELDKVMPIKLPFWKKYLFHLTSLMILIVVGSCFLISQNTNESNFEKLASSENIELINQNDIAEITASPKSENTIELNKINRSNPVESPKYSTPIENTASIAKSKVSDNSLNKLEKSTDTDLDEMPKRNTTIAGTGQGPSQKPIFGSVPKPVAAIDNDLKDPNTPLFSDVSKKSLAGNQSQKLSFESESELLNIPFLSKILPAKFSNSRDHEVLDRDPIVKLKKTKSGTKNAWSISAFSSISLVDSKYSSSNTESTSLAERKNNSEASLESITYGASVGYDFGKFTISAGLEQRITNEKFSASSTIDTSRTVENVVIKQQVNNITGTTNDVYGSAVQNGIKTTDRTHYNQYKQLNIPVSISYEMASFKNFSVGMNIGGNVNISAEKAGFSFDENNVIADVQTSDLYKKNFGLSLYLEPTINYALSDKLSIGLQLRHTRGLNNMLNSQELVQKMNFTGIGLSLLTRF